MARRAPAVPARRWLGPARAGAAAVQLEVREADAHCFAIGIVGPWTRPVLGELVAGGAAERAGLRAGDLVLRVGSGDVVDGSQLRELIRASGRGAASRAALAWRVERDGQQLDLLVQADVVPGGQGSVGA